MDELTLDTHAGRAVLHFGPLDCAVRGESFAAVWAHGVPRDELPLEARGRAPTMQDVRAGALLAATEEGLTVSRGPYGGRPLYYRREGSNVVVSSTLTAIVETLGAHASFDVDCLGALGLARARPDPRATPYRGVKRVLPCETITFTADGDRSSFMVPRRHSAPPGDARDHAHLLREELSRAIARAIAGFSSVAVFTGGGLDSSGLLALVAQRAALTGLPRFTGVTYDFAGPGDDRPHLVALLESLGASTLRISPREIDKLHASLFAEDAAPCTWPTSPTEMLAVRRAKAWGADVLMGGTGGDDVLDGDETRFARRLRGGDLGAILDAARQRVTWTRSTRVKVTELILRPVLRPWVPPSLLAWRRQRWLRKREAWRWAGPRLRPLLSAVPPGLRPPNDDWAAFLALDHASMDYADARGQTEVGCGLPWVDPYLDPTFVELVASLPPDELFYDHRQRGLFRLAMTGLFPESLRVRPDKASFEPMADEMFAAAGGFRELDELLTMEATADLGLVLPQAFRVTFERVVRKEATARGWLEVWPMLAVESFLRTSARGRSEDPSAQFARGTA